MIYKHNAQGSLYGFAEGRRPEAYPYILGRTWIQPKINTKGIICFLSHQIKMKIDNANYWNMVTVYIAILVSHLLLLSADFYSRLSYLEVYDFSRFVSTSWNKFNCLPFRNTFTTNFKYFVIWPQRFVAASVCKIKLYDIKSSPK